MDNNAATNGPTTQPDNAKQFSDFFSNQIQPAAVDDFRLEVAPASGVKKPLQFHDQGGLQRNLIDGCECLPGQMDLFEGDSDHA